MPSPVPKFDPTNEEMPSRVPRRPMGSIPVIVRLVDEQGTVWLMPATANRWTATHVLVVYPAAEGSVRPTRLAWLRAQDVRRVVRYPRSPR